MIVLRHVNDHLAVIFQTEWLYLKVVQNPMKKNRQSSIVFEKAGILPETLKTLPSSN